MRLRISVSELEDSLESHRPRDKDVHWELITSGFWREDLHHSGHIAYYLARVNPGYWVVNALERNAELDSVTEEDVEEGKLNDDQIQAMGHMTLQEAQEQVYERIVAICQEAPLQSSSKDMAKLLYSKLCAAGGKKVTDPDDIESLLRA